MAAFALVLVARAVDDTGADALGGDEAQDLQIAHAVERRAEFDVLKVELLGVVKRAPGLGVDHRYVATRDALHSGREPERAVGFARGAGAGDAEQKRHVLS